MRKLGVGFVRHASGFSSPVDLFGDGLVMEGTGLFTVAEGSASNGDDSFVLPIGCGDMVRSESLGRRPNSRVTGAKDASGLLLDLRVGEEFVQSFKAVPEVQN